jgi:hypothetical protein
MITNQTNLNKNNNQNINRRDRYDTYRCRHGRECMVKKDIIFKN